MNKSTQEERIEEALHQMQSINALAERAVQVAQQQAKATEIYRDAFEGLLHTTVQQQLIDALQTQGSHQKQQFLWLIAKTLGLNLSDVEIIEQRLCTVERPLPIHICVQKARIADGVLQHLREFKSITVDPTPEFNFRSDRWYHIRFAETIVIEQIDPRSLLKTIGYFSRFEQDEAIFYDRTFRIILPDGYSIIYIDMQDKALSLLAVDKDTGATKDPPIEIAPSENPL